ncbi:MAG: endonuclease/exonuclease/phosphatase family protein [Ilumatobacteraceae bacterium]
MLIATWNVNSLKARLGRVERWLTTFEPDVVCLQETKVTDDLFPHVYGPIPISAVAATVVWRREAGLGALTRAASPDHP